MLNHNIRKDLLEQDYGYRKLHSEHQKLEHEIEEMQMRPSVDGTRLHELRRQKLQVKDKMHILEETLMH